MNSGFGFRNASCQDSSNGIDSAISGFLFVNGNGEVLCYQKADRQVFADFLFVNSRFEKSSTEKDKYGYLERETESIILS